MKEKSTRTAHGTPVGTSEEEEGLQADGRLPEQDPEPAQFAPANESERPVPPRHGQGSSPTKEEDIPLSEKTGEGRVDRSGRLGADSKDALRDALDEE